MAKSVAEQSSNRMFSPYIPYLTTYLPNNLPFGCSVGIEIIDDNEHGMSSSL